MPGTSTIDKVVIAVETLRTSEWGSKEHGDAHSFLFKLFEKELKEWVKLHPPGSADYTEASPERAVYLYSDEIDRSLPVGPLKDILLTNLSYFGKVVKRALGATKTASKRFEKDVVAAQHPEYLDLLARIRDAKKAWNAEDAQIKQSHNFRMMGGLARLGSRSGMEYSRLVAKAQQMEKSSLGKILTGHHRAG